MAEAEESAPKRRRTGEGNDGGEEAAIDGSAPQSLQPNAVKVDGYLKILGSGEKVLKDILAALEARGADVVGALEDMLRSKIDTESCKLFVRSLGWSTKADQVREVFEEFGHIKDLIVIEKDGKSKGYGFVTFANALEAANALQQSKKFIDGRETYCNLASRPDEGRHSNQQQLQQQGGGGGMGGGGMGGGMGGGGGGGPVDAHGMTQEQKDQCRLFIRSLDWNTGEDTLRRAFEPFGRVLDCAVIMDKDTGKSKGYGFITFATPQEAQEALKERQKQIDGRTTYCNLASDRKRPNTSMMPSTYDPNQALYQNQMQQYMQQLQMQQQYYSNPQAAAGMMGQQAAAATPAMGQQAAGMGIAAAGGMDAAAAAQQQQAGFAAAAAGYQQPQPAAQQQWAQQAQQQPAMGQQWGQQANGMQQQYGFQ